MSAGNPDPFGVESWYRDESEAIPALQSEATSPTGVGERPGGAPRRRTLALVALALAAVAALAVGLGTNGVLATFDVLAPEPLAGPRRWGLVAVVGALVGTAALVVGIVATIRSTRALGALAIAAALVLPLGAAVLGLYTGVESLKSHLARDAGGAATAAIDSVQDFIAGIGPIGDQIGGWLEERVGT